MSILIDVGKVVGIIVALIAVRFIIKTVLKNPKIPKPARGTLTFLLPPLITGGPMFIAIPASLYAMESPEISSYAFMALAGGAGLSIGLAAMFVILQRRDTRQRIGPA